MVSRAASTCSNSDRAVAHHRHRRMQRMGLAAQRHELLARRSAVGGLENRRSPSASVWSAPSTMPAGHLRRTRRGPFRAPATPRPRRDRRGRRRASMPRSSISAGLDLDRHARGFQHRAPHRAFGGEHQRCVGEPQRHLRPPTLPAALGQQRHHRRGGFLDRAAGHVDDRPVVPAAQLARERDLRRHRLAVDVLVGVVLGPQPEQPVLADLHDALRACGQARPPAAALSVSRFGGTGTPGTSGTFAVLTPRLAR